MKRRILAILLAAIMVLSVVPFSAFAEEATVACPGKGEIHTLDNCESEKFAEVAPVCNKPGYDVYTCLNPECGDQFIVITKEASNTPHTLVKATKAATCTATGIKEDRWQCTACKDYFSDAEGKNVTTDYETAKLDHKKNGVSQWKALANDCTTQKCELCGATRVTPTEGGHDGAHNYKVIKFHTPAATCKDAAKADVKCTVCGHEKYNVEVASDVPHTLGTLVTAKAATCTEDGWNAYYKCSVCNKYFDSSKAEKSWNDIKINKLGHAATYLISEKPATCTTDGSRTYRCGREGCGEFIENEVIPKNPIKGYWIYNKDTGKYVEKDGAKVIVKKTGDKTYAVWYGNKDLDYPTAENGTLGEKQEFRDANIVLHKFSVATKEATCTEYGYTKKVCILCGTEETVNIKAPTNHLKADGTVNGTKIVDATELADLAAKGIKPIDATCTTAGVDLYKCACNAVVSVKVNAWGHGTDVTVSTAHCSDKGVTFTYTEGPKVSGWACTCGAYTKKSTWTNDQGTEDTADDITYKLWIPASVTADAKGEFVAKELWLKAGSVTEAAKNSTHIMREEIVNKATCTVAGNKVDFCLACGYNTPATIPATGHKFEIQWKDDTKDADKTLANILTKTKNVTDVKPDCTTDGYYKILCSNGCGDYSNADSKATNGWSLKINKLGHAEKTVVVTPTCTAPAGYSYKMCTRTGCTWNTNTEEGRFDKTTYSEKVSYTTDDVKISHPNLTLKVNESNKGDWKAVYKVGSCTVVGLDEYECPDCHRAILVIQGGTGSHLKPTTGVTAKVDSTCCDTGTTESYTCARCNASVGGETIEKKAHNYVVVFNAKAPVCKADGTLVDGYVTLYTCDASSCCKNKKFFVKVAYTEDNQTKYRYDEITVNADLKDVFKEGKVDKGVVADGEGVKTYTGVKVAAEHDYTNSTAKLPTCTEGGYTKKCNVCGYEFEKVGPTHTFDAKVTYAVDCLTDGYSIETCVACDYVKITGYKAALGHDLGAEQTVTGSCSTGPSYKYKECSRTECPVTDKKIITTGYTYYEHKNADGLAIGLANDTIICTVGLNEEARTCKACGWKAAADHHVEKTTVVSATCTTDGYTVVTCVTCKAVLATTVVVDSKLNHVKAGVSCYAEDTAQYVAPTETEPGKRVYVCSECGDSYDTIINPTSTIYLDLAYANANGKEGFAESSLVTVKVVLSSKKAAIRTLNYGLDYDQTKLEFVSATYSNTFSVSAINNDAANGVVNFAGMSANPVEVGEAVEIATVTFRIKGDIGATTAPFSFTADTKAYLETGVEVLVNKDLDPASITIVKLMNVYDKDATIDMQDALAIYDIIQAKGYNVAADLDKDGTVDAYDLQLFYNYFVGSMTAEEIFAAN